MREYKHVVIFFVCRFYNFEHNITLPASARQNGANPVILKSEFIMSLCEQPIGGNNLGAVQKSIIDRCTASVYRTYQQNNYTGEVPTLQDFRAELLKQSEPEAQEIALAIELFTNGVLVL